MDCPQVLLRQRLRTATAALEAIGGPSAFTAEKRPALWYRPDGALWFEDAFACMAQRETYYPAAAVVATLRYPDLQTLQADWYAVLRPGAVFPIYWAFLQGHDTAFIPESVVLDWLIYLMPECDAYLRAD
jgi:hypothetical protein